MNRRCENAIYRRVVYIRKLFKIRCAVNLSLERVKTWGKVSISLICRLK